MPDFSQEVRSCTDCMVYEDRHHAHYCRKLGIPADSEIMVYTLPSGMTMRFSAEMPEVPIWWDFILCPTHTAKAA